MIIEVQKCSDEIRNKDPINPSCDPAYTTCETVDPICATPEEIIAWTASKRLYVESLNANIDFSS